MVSILDLPLEILGIIASTLHAGDIAALARTNTMLYPKIQYYLLRHNVKYQKSSALHWAAKTNNGALVKDLLAHRADVNALIDQCSPLIIASKHDALSVVELLMFQQQLRANKRDGNGKSALWYSVVNDSVDLVSRLLEDPRVKIDHANRDGQTVLWLAVFQGNRRLVDLLLSKGASLDLKDRDGISPWMQSCIRDRNGIKDRILDQYQVKAAGTLSSNRVLARKAKTVVTAVKDGDVAELRQLHLREGLDATLLNCKDHYGRTALWISTYSSLEKITERLLEEHDVNLNTLGKNSDYEAPSTPLSHLMIRFYPTMLRRFLAMPSLDVNLGVGSLSPLYLAVKQGNIPAVRLLIAHKDIQINATLPHADSPLHLATLKGNIDVVKLLVAQGDRLHVNQLTHLDEETALSIAARQGNLDILNVLLSHRRIDMDIIDRWGRTALRSAFRQEQVGVVERLLGGPITPRQLVISLEIANLHQNNRLQALLEEKIHKKRQLCS
ncbi:hypothetical protein N7520_009617 [Penicillium odoratum]|uniref:uncharacterized protein n=1 Tax=Penicillium odoratum TaxID=1167516 RepID=UPI002549BFEC|nr:uncharacterized protein N7520_009617 [Penicillium odoratum]KAJ5752700.1 hypothetical protein N7520_009617 [Penicillium odoratum]